MTTRTTARAQLAREMAARGLRQADLAEQLAVTQTSVSLWLRGLSRPKPHLRMALERLLKIPTRGWLTVAERDALELVRRRTEDTAP
ncbi:MAG: helix-turn-helix domain-containing protein [Alphaproteobacteria bacterium]